MANLLESSQTSTTTAPDYYNTHLTNLATKGAAATDAAQYVGAQPLQEQAFAQIGETANKFQPSITAGQNLVNQGAAKDIVGAADPYLQAGTNKSALSALDPYASKITSASPADLASQYMNPYINTAVQSMSDIAQRNIQQNLAPQATAAAVGSGQFGSQRGAQVLGQVNRQAQQDLNAEISKMLGTGYGQALTAAGQYQSTLGQVGSTAANAQNAENLSQISAGKTAGDLTNLQAQELNRSGIDLGTLGTQGNTMNLADVNALSALGGQQQQIGQNEQNYPLTKLASLSNIMQGAQIPTTVTSKLNASPLSTLASLGSTGLGLIQPKYDKDGKEIPNSSPLSTISNFFKGATNSPTGTVDSTSPSTPTGTTGSDVNGNPIVWNGSQWIDNSPNGQGAVVDPRNIPSNLTGGTNVGGDPTAPYDPNLYDADGNLNP
jgi:hypothetical protein